MDQIDRTVLEQRDAITIIIKKNWIRKWRIITKAYKPSSMYFFFFFLITLPFLRHFRVIKLGPKGHVYANKNTEARSSCENKNVVIFYNNCKCFYCCLWDLRSENWSGIWKRWIPTSTSKYNQEHISVLLFIQGVWEKSEGIELIPMI